MVYLSISKFSVEVLDIRVLELRVKGKGLGCRI
jgi:hypothetical protein